MLFAREIYEVAEEYGIGFFIGEEKKLHQNAQCMEMAAGKGSKAEKVFQRRSGSCLQTYS
jgi:hypothetical protein